MAQFGKRVSVLLLLLVTTYQLTGSGASTTTGPTVQNTTASFYCDVTYECSDPFTFDSTSNLEEAQCACREGWLRTSTCCLSQWWFIGLAAGAGAIVLLAFIIALGCCCCYKSDAKKAKTAAKMAAGASHGNHKSHGDIELDDDIKSAHHHNQHNHHPAATTAAMMTFAANEHDSNHKPHDADKHNHSADAHAVTAAHAAHPVHAAPAAHAAHGNDHAAAAHPVATTAAVAAVVHEVKDNSNTHHDHTPSHVSPNTHHTQPNNHYASEPHHQQPRNSPKQNHYQYQESRPYNRYQSQTGGYQGGHGVDPYYPPAGRHPPYGAYSNPRFSEDNDSLETYDDTALPSTSHGNYNNSPGLYNYDDHNGSSNKKNALESNSSLLKIDSTSQFVINRPSVHF